MSNSDQGKSLTNGITSRRQVLRALGAVGVIGTAGMSWPVSARSSITLDGQISGWQGVSPDDIADETNPTLTFEPGEAVTVEWTNRDGMGHNFVVVDGNEQELLSSDIMAEQGETQTVEFTATEEMSEYFCQPHPQSMRGSVEITGSTEDDEQTETDGDDETDPSPFTKRQLASDLTDPMAIEIAPDGRVFYTTRGGNFSEDAEDETTGTGRVGVIDPESGEITTALEIDVYTGQEDGLQGLAFDPAFEENGWVYLFYSPPNEVVGDEPYNQLSRFRVRGNSIDPDCEVEILRVPTQRETCCHAGGDIEFGPSGDLYLSTGDDTNPHESDGYTPIDERDGREPYDAQRTAANTADLRGKILRISPEDDGSYSVPDDNLFPQDEYAAEIEDGLVRPEIYVMGVRNPFRMSVDQKTGVLHYADYGPDAGEWDAGRGPIGIVEINSVSEPMNAGWPYVRGPNHPYVEYDFETEESDGPFDPANPVNGSPNNDGLEELPSVRPATLWYPFSWDAYTDAPDYAAVPDEAPWPTLEGGAPMGGPVYRYSDDSGAGALPEEYDGKHFIAEWGANWLKTVEYAEDGSVTDIAAFMPNAKLLSPMDLEIGPNGVLYLLEWGEGYEGSNAGIYRIEHDGQSG
ncbi:PQQ-dependent sugar dehydrogenase [Halocatena salina]|uniref:PQQ-dependent sugar dehydrogenase n=1 Tax=Halocatena salina TaxID=2934340 RepID=A0A8U0A705_9EURY|nr:PQQ-dependent sugar dehydrogenase [Halocatena salina]UPM44308.1 PQQ-dependent sugar dehydrogenase [Halocatena salina]